MTIKRNILGLLGRFEVHLALREAPLARSIAGDRADLVTIKRVEPHLRDPFPEVAPTL